MQILTHARTVFSILPVIKVFMRRKGCKIKGRLVILRPSFLFLTSFKPTLFLYDCPFPVRSSQAQFLFSFLRFIEKSTYIHSYILIFLFACLSFCLPAPVPLCLSVYWLVCLSWSVYLSACLSVCLCFCLSVCLSVCLCHSLHLSGRPCPCPSIKCGPTWVRRGDGGAWGQHSFDRNPFSPEMETFPYTAPNSDKTSFINKFQVDANQSNSFANSTNLEHVHLGWKDGGRGEPDVADWLIDRLMD